MGGIDKPLLTIGGRTLLGHVAQRLGPQCRGLAINANGDPKRFGAMDLPVVKDSIPGHLGPLAGILAALEWVSASRPGIEWVVTCPGDTPFVPKDLVLKLHEARERFREPMACAVSGSNIHHAVGLWPVCLRGDLRDAIVAEGLRSIQKWTTPHGVAHASWADAPLDPFFNINTSSELAEAEIIFERYPGL
jgi:molybdopterin-guanine dinucleotide biosynthesis protein A